MKKTLAIAIMLVMVLLLLTACNNGDAAGATPPASADKPEASDAPIELGKLAIVVVGEALTLPMSVEDFVALGWEPIDEKTAEKLEKTLGPREFTYFTFKKGDYYEQPFIANLSGSETITVNQGTIVGLNDIRSDEGLELPNGIVQGVSTRGDVIAAYGEPDEVDSWGKWIEYNMEGMAVNMVVGQAETDVIGLVKIELVDMRDRLTQAHF